MSMSRLVRQRERPIRPGDEREDRRAVELLDLARGDRPIEDIDRDAHDLALLLAELGDGVDERPLGEGQADDDLVDDLLVQDGLEALQRPEVGQRSDEAKRRVVVEEADHPQAELPMALQLGGEGLAPRSGAEDEDEAQVAAAPPQPLEARSGGPAWRRWSATAVIGKR